MVRFPGRKVQGTDGSIKIYWASREVLSAVKGNLLSISSSGVIEIER